MTKTKRNIGVTLLLLFAVAIVIIFLYPCGPGGGESHSDVNTDKPPESKFSFFKKKTRPPQDKPAPHETVTLPTDKAAAIEEIDHAPPVTLNATDEIPNVAKCVTRNFPKEAKPYVKNAVVTVRLIVNKFGTVRGVTPLEVELPPNVDEEQVPAMRKLFIQAGRSAFGSKKCPPHLVNGQSVGYAIEVPLAYKQ